MTETSDKTFKYKLDFYYQSALIYLITLVLYGGIKGSFVEREFILVMNDPIIYVIIFFVLMSFGALILNRIRNRRLLIGDDELIFKSRFRERVIKVADIEWMHIGREARVRTSGRFQVIILKIKGKRRLFRIRVGRYERDKDLIAEMESIAERVPKRKRPQWRRRKFTDR